METSTHRQRILPTERHGPVQIEATHRRFVSTLDLVRDPADEVRLDDIGQAVTLPSILEPDGIVFGLARDIEIQGDVEAEGLCFIHEGSRLGPNDEDLDDGGSDETYVLYRFERESVLPGLLLEPSHLLLFESGQIDDGQSMFLFQHGPMVRRLGRRWRSTKDLSGMRPRRSLNDLDIAPRSRSNRTMWRGTFTDGRGRRTFAESGERTFSSGRTFAEGSGRAATWGRTFAKGSGRAATWGRTFAKGLGRTFAKGPGRAVGDGLK